jgi:hypothetical protein
LREVRVYKTERGAMGAFDNGGRFYDLFARAHDGRIHRGELAVATEESNDVHAALLYFTLAITGLDEDARDRVVASLQSSLRSQLEEMDIRWISPGQLSEMDFRSWVILRGRPRFREPVEVRSVSGHSGPKWSAARWQVYEARGGRCAVVLPNGRRMPQREVLVAGQVRRHFLTPVGGPRAEYETYLRGHYWADDAVGSDATLFADDDDVDDSSVGALGLPVAVSATRHKKSKT